MQTHGSQWSFLIKQSSNKTNLSCDLPAVFSLHQSPLSVMRLKINTEIN